MTASSFVIGLRIENFILVLMCVTLVCRRFSNRAPTAATLCTFDYLVLSAVLSVKKENNFFNGKRYINIRYIFDKSRRFCKIFLLQFDESFQKATYKFDRLASHLILSFALPKYRFIAALLSQQNCHRFAVACNLFFSSFN